MDRWIVCAGLDLFHFFIHRSSSAATAVLCYAMLLLYVMRQLE